MEENTTYPNKQQIHVFRLPSWMLSTLFQSGILAIKFDREAASSTSILLFPENLSGTNIPLMQCWWKCKWYRLCRKQAFPYKIEHTYPMTQ